MDKVYYTYLYLREDCSPYYVGKGTGPRAFARHNDHGIYTPKDSNRILIQEFPSEADAFAAEVFLILYFGRKDLGTGILYNRTPGGDAPPVAPPEAYTAEASEKKRRSQTGKRWKQRKRRVTSPAVRLALSLAAKRRMSTPEGIANVTKAGRKSCEVNLRNPVTGCFANYRNP